MALQENQEFRWWKTIALAHQAVVRFIPKVGWVNISFGGGQHLFREAKRMVHYSLAKEAKEKAEMEAIYKLPEREIELKID